jgi:UDP-glucose 4-epimerase
MRIVVTGGVGFIGSNLADALVARGDDVLVIDDLSTGTLANLNAEARFEQLDVRTEAAAAAVRRFRPQAVMHLAAQMSVGRSVREPLYDAEVNVLGALRMLEAAREAGARFVFASTGGALYGDAETLPTPEVCPAWPVSPYGVAKLSVEHYLHCYRFTHGLSYVALRYANVYGPRQNPHGEAGVVAIFCRALLASVQPVITGDGRQTRDYVFVGDVVRANLLAVDARASGHYNVGTGVQTDVNALFQLIAERVGGNVTARHGDPRPGEQRTSALDSRLILKELGWRPEVTLAEGISQTVDWFCRLTASEASLAAAKAI